MNIHHNSLWLISRYTYGVFAACLSDIPPVYEQAQHWLSNQQ